MAHGYGLSELYGLLMRFRNALYDKGLRQTYRPQTPTISIGNLTVGGTGKTPMVEFLVRMLNRQGFPKPQLATLSRGYGRQTRGFRVADAHDTAATIGDEPLQLYRKFGRSLYVCVGEQRADAIRQMQTRWPDLSCILLDDAYQHRAVQPHLSILLTDYSRPFYDDVPFPFGRLREGREGANRADAVIVTKCPDNLSKPQQARIADRIRPYVKPKTPIWFSGLTYSLPVPFSKNPNAPQPSAVVLVSGLANPNALETYVSTHFTMIRHLRFPDHHAYTRADLEKMIRELPAYTSVLTTEKDGVKLDALLTDTERANWPLYYLPVAMTLPAEAEAALENRIRTVTGRA